MSIYKPQEEVITTCDIKLEQGKICLEFSADCGKFGTDEILDSYYLTPKRLLEILQDQTIEYEDHEL